MSNVVSLHKTPHVRIESGRCTSSDDGSLVGRWVFVVIYVDEDGGELTDYVGTDRNAADQAAVGWARDVGCRIFDHSTEEPQA